MQPSVPGSEVERKGKREKKRKAWTIAAVIAVVFSNIWVIQRLRMNQAEAYSAPSDLSLSGIFWVSSQHKAEPILLEWWTTNGRAWMKYDQKVLPMHPAIKRALSYLIFDIAHTPPTEVRKNLKPHAILTIFPDHTLRRKEVYFAFDLELPYAFTPSWQVRLDEDWFSFLRHFRTNLEAVYVSNWTDITLETMESIELERQDLKIKVRRLAGRWILERPEKRILKNPAKVEHWVHRMSKIAPTHWQSKERNLSRYPYRLRMTRYPGHQHTFEWDPGTQHAKITEQNGTKSSHFYVDIEQDPQMLFDHFLTLSTRD